ncbi:hypothetical protein MPSEU_000354400 [Mayamaea pseudoterrestris]|nr:hypothetical protein MPSEU_000354400 [Mayamaea pseudoterrestris]
MKTIHQCCIRRQFIWLLRVVAILLAASTLRLWRRVARLEWRQAVDDTFDERQQRMSYKLDSSTKKHAANSSNIHHRILYIGQFGFGHRMSKLSAAVHLAKRADVSHVEVSFGYCGNNKTLEWDIFHDLFGIRVLDLRDFLDMPTNATVTAAGASTNENQSPANNNISTTNKIVLIRNDVLGYYAGQSYKNARLPLPHPNELPVAWMDKLETDVALFRYLMQKFMQRHANNYLQQQFVIHNEDNTSSRMILDRKKHFVIGLHLRAGNGEGYHFQQAQRGDESMSTKDFCDRLIALITNAIQSDEFYFHGEQRHQPVIFLATDTASLIPLFTQAARRQNLIVVSLPQPRVATNRGVSYAAWTHGVQCLAGWRSSLMDTLFLSVGAHVLIAARRSTFTQIVPLALQFERNEQEKAIQDEGGVLSFCEVADNADRMTCFGSRAAWVLRPTGSNDIVSFSSKGKADNDESASRANQSTVVHKLMVHLPDVLNGKSDVENHISKIQMFLRDSEKEYYVYGDRINPKYRSKALVFRENWTFKNSNIRRRVVVTGLGAITPLGNTFADTWKALLANQSGVTSLTQALRMQHLKCLATTEKYDQEDEYDIEAIERDLEIVQHLSCQVAAPVRSVAKDHKTPRFVQFALMASQQALQQSQLLHLLQQDDSCSNNNPLHFRTGVSIGSGMSSVRQVVDASRLTSLKRLSPHFVPSVLQNSASARVAIQYQLGGPNVSASTACAAGTHAIGDAAMYVASNMADVMMCGGTEAAMDPLSLAGFGRLRALSTSYNDDPSLASRPFHEHRDGFVMAEGAAVLVLEELEHALRRNAPILAELTGYGVAGDGFHITSPDPQGRGAARAMRMALNHAGVFDEASVDYVNAHATSTPVGDEIEAKVICDVFGCSNDATVTQGPWVSSTKGATGHLLGAAGALEAAFTVQALVDQTIPVTLNLSEEIMLACSDSGPDSADYIRRLRHVYTPQQQDINMAMSNSFGFGGTNASLLFQKWE